MNPIPQKNVNDPMAQLARNALRQSNVALFPTTLRKLQQRTKVKSASTSLDATLKLLSAEMMRASGQLQSALTVTNEVVANPPVGSPEILSQAERLLVSLLLDTGNVRQALATASGIDGMVIENVEAGSSISLTSRNTENISVETYISEAEASIYAGKLDEAMKLLSAAVNRLTSEEAKTAEKKINSYELKKINARFTDLRYDLHFWGAVLKIIGGDMTAYDTLSGLLERLQNDSHSDKRLIARVRAVLGEFDVDNQTPPTGICFAEAMRLWKLVTQQTIEVTQSDLVAESSNSPSNFQPQLETAGVLTGSGSASLPAVSYPQTIQAYPGANNVPSNDLHDKFSLLLDKFSEVLDKLPMTSPAVAAKDNRRPFAFGGGFQFVDLITLLEEAENSGLTGFFQVQWKPDMIETTVLAGNISPVARAGEGFIFMREGTIIDACIGSYDPDPRFEPGTPEGESDAKQNLKILLQIGTGKKLDHEPEGFGEAYPSAAVKHRAVRFEFQPSSMMLLLTEMDDELHEA